MKRVPISIAALILKMHETKMKWNTGNRVTIHTPHARKTGVTMASQERIAMPRETIAQKRQRAHKVEARMFERYGEGACSLDHTDPFTLTVAVILSAQCTDAAVNKVTPELFARYGTPESMASAPIESIEEIIHPLGFFRSKAKNIRGCARVLLTDFGGIVPQDMDKLQTLPGVGRKTANVVMCQAFRDPQGIAVDTHVFRIAHRLAFASRADDTPEKAEAKLMKIYPQSEWLYINHQWVHFGREFCSAKRPKCADCFICDLCPAAK